MSVIDQLEIIDGYFDGNNFVMRGINGFAVTGRYKADGLLSLSRLIHDNEPFTIVIDQERRISVPMAANKQIKKELVLIAEELRLGLI